LIYSGQELPMKDKRLFFFEKDLIPWAGERALHDFYKSLLNLRATNPALRAADETVRTFRLDTTDNVNIFGFLRKKDDREVLVMLNLSALKRRIKIIGKVINGQYKDIFSGESINIDSDRSLDLEEWGYRVYQK